MSGSNIYQLGNTVEWQVTVNQLLETITLKPNKGNNNN